MSWLPHTVLGVEEEKICFSSERSGVEEGGQFGETVPKSER